MKGFKLNVTRDSLNTIKELRNYSWKKDKQGELTGDPIDNWNHSIDAIRYGISHIRRNPNYGNYSVS
jgi:phage terminase large subunit